MRTTTTTGGGAARVFIAENGDYIIHGVLQPVVTPVSISGTSVYQPVPPVHQSVSSPVSRAHPRSMPNNAGRGRQYGSDVLRSSIV